MPRVIKIEITEEAETLKKLLVQVRKVLQDLNQTLITSVTGWNFIIEALRLAGI